MKYALRITPANREFVGSTMLQARDAYRDLLSICEGILADKEVNSAEAAYLRNWIARHPQHHAAWPFPDLIARLDAMFFDGVVSTDECSELADILNSLIGARIVHSDARLPGAGMAGPTQLIFDQPAPVVLFPGREFCVTGVFAYGKRETVERAIQARGGFTIKAPRTATDYVLVGSFVSPGWASGNFGTKIERALSIKNNGTAIAIIGEEHWKTFLV